MHSVALLSGDVSGVCQRTPKILNCEIHYFMVVVNLLHVIILFILVPIESTLDAFSGFIALHDNFFP